MKTMRFIAPIAALVILAAFALNSCSNAVDLPEEAASASQGFGTVRVSVGLGQAQDAARTAKPTLPAGWDVRDAFDQGDGIYFSSRSVEVSLTNATRTGERTSQSVSRST